MNQIEQAEAVFVIFGSTGDLAKRKLFPSIYNLYRKGNLNEHFAVVGLGRREWDDEKLRTVVMESIQEELGGQSPEVTESFLKHFSYLSFDVTNKDSYSKLNDKLHILDETFQIPGNRIFIWQWHLNFLGKLRSQYITKG